MHGTFIPTREDLVSTIREAVKAELVDTVPEIVSEAVAKPFLTKQELMELTGWSARTIQHLRDSRQIPFSQHGHKILYPRKGIMQFLKAHHIKPRTKD